MNKILFFLLFIPLFIANPAFSQSKKTVKAKIISKEDGLPVIGATVLIKGTTIGTAANVDGTFEIKAKPTDMLEISAIGFVAKKIKACDIKTGQALQLVADVVSLKEVAVVGYGVQERRDLTGSVSSVNIRELDKTALNIDNALSGKISGVMVNSSSGQPGSATSILIRGISSLSTDGEANNPLIVIDGVPVYSSSRGRNTTGFGSTSVAAASIGGGGAIGQQSSPVDEFERNPLANINPEDIESIEVLKDAFATAIYGSRGSAGVILITTKKGAKGKPKVNINYSVGISNPIGTPDVLNADEYRSVYSELGNLPKDPGASTDWLDEVIRTAVTNKLSASVSSGTDKSTYYISMSRLDQDAYIVGNDFSRTSARFNFNYKDRDFLSYGVNVSATLTDNNSLNSAKIYANAITRRPIDPIYDEDGSYHYTGGKNNDENPMQIANDDINYLKDTRVVGNLYCEYKPLGWLTLKTELGADIFSSEAFSRLMARKGWLEGGSATQTTSSNMKYVINNTATAVKVLGDHSINAVLGQSFESSRENRTSVGGNGFVSDDEIGVILAKNRSVSNAAVEEWAMFSAFARVNYQYMSRYMFGATYRIDGSSKYDQNKRYIGFPSFSLGWRASEEDFMLQFPFIDDLKFRGSFGFTGTDGSGGYYGNQGTYVRQSQALMYGGSLIYELNNPSNPNLKWEKTSSYDLGMDLEVLDNRIKFTFDYYMKKVTNMITNVPIATYRGFSSIKRNFGDMENSGFEMDLYTENVKTDFTWTTNLNISRNTNKITRLNLGDQSGTSIYVEGEAAPQFQLYEWGGVDPATGNPIWLLPDGSKTVNPNTGVADGSAPAQMGEDGASHRKTFGTYLPDFYGGLTNNFNYKGFELSAFLSFSYGGQMINGTKAHLLSYTSIDRNNLDKDVLDYWLIDGHKTDIPKLKNASIIGNNDYTAGTNTTRFLEDNSYIRLKTLTLSYNFSHDILRKLHMRRLKVYVQGTNLFTLTKYSGVDPEVSAFGSNALMGGYDLLTLPQSKTIQFGVNIGF